MFKVALKYCVLLEVLIQLSQRVNNGTCLRMGQNILMKGR